MNNKIISNRDNMKAMKDKWSEDRKFEASLEGVIREGHSGVWNLNWYLKDEKCQNQRGKQKSWQNEGQVQKLWGMEKLGISQEMEETFS